MFKTKKSRIPAVYRMLLVAIAVMAIGGIAVNCYVGNYYRADSIAKAAIDSDREISVTIEKKDKRIQATQYDLKHKNYTITFAPQDKEKATKALIFYPGGRVQYTAYAPLMHELAKNNFVCICRATSQYWTRMQLTVSLKNTRKYTHPYRNGTWEVTP